MGAKGDIAGRKESSVSLYILRYYFLCLYEVLIVALYSAVVGIDLNFRI